jgi:hypothetical protein
MKGFLHLAPGLRAVHVVSESRINLGDDMEVPEESFLVWVFLSFINCWLEKEEERE